MRCVGGYGFLKGKPVCPNLIKKALEVDPSNAAVQSKLYFNRAVVYHKVVLLFNVATMNYDC